MLTFSGVTRDKALLIALSRQGCDGCDWKSDVSPDAKESAAHSAQMSRPAKLKERRARLHDGRAHSLGPRPGRSYNIVQLTQRTPAILESMQSKRLSERPGAKVHHRTTMGLEQRAQTRARIVNAAVAVFAKNGPYTSVIEDVVKAAGISRGSFYNYFSTIEEVREAAVEITVDGFIAEIEPAVERITNPIIRFATAARLYQRKARRDPAFAAFVTSVTNVPGIIDKNSHRDLKDAVNQKLVGVSDIDAAFLISVAVNQYAARYFLQRPQGPLRAKDFVRSILLAWRVEPALIDQALAVSLENLP